MLRMTTVLERWMLFVLLAGIGCNQEVISSNGGSSKDSAAGGEFWP